MNCNGVKEGAIISNLRHVLSSNLGGKPNRPKTKPPNTPNIPSLHYSLNPRLCH